MKTLCKWAPMILALAALPVAAGDVAAGKAKSATCAACHGADGNSPTPDFPKLAGQHQDYLLRFPAGYTCHFPRPGWKLPRRAKI